MLTKSKWCIILATMICFVTSTLLALAETRINWDIDKPVKKEVKPPQPMEINLDFCLSDPMAIDVDDYGRIYVLDHARKAVIRFDSNGEMDALWPEDGCHNSSYAEGRMGMSVLPNDRVILGPNWTIKNRRVLGPGLGDEEILPTLEDTQRMLGSMSPDGTTYLLHCPDSYLGEKEYYVSAYSPDGTRLAKWTVPETANVVYGQDGYVYVPLYKEPKILVFKQDGTKYREISLAKILGSEATILSYSLSVDKSGDLYMMQGFEFYHLDSNGNKLFYGHTFPDMMAGGCVCIGKPVLKNGLVYYLSNRDQLVVPNKDGNGYTAKNTGRISYEIQVYTPDGKCVARYIPKRLVLELPSAIAVQKDGTCAVTTLGMYNGVAVISPTGDVLQPRAPMSYNMYSVMANPKGGFFGVGGMDFVEIDNSGNWGRKLESPGPLNADDACIYTPGQLTVDPKTGDIWGLGGAGTLIQYDPNGKLLNRTGNLHHLNFKTYCIGMAMDKDGFIYVSDAWGHRIVKTDKDGNIVAQFGKEGTALGELKYPEQIALDNEGRLYVADSGNSRISVFDTDGKPLGFWGHRGSGEGELDRPYGVTLGPKDTLWIADTFNDRIVKVPLTDFWSAVKKDFVEAKAAPAPKKQPVPNPGQVTITGFVTAGTDDFSDCIYVESPDQQWGTRVTLKDDVVALRGETCKITGIFELKERAAKHLIASKVEQIKINADQPAPLEMANLYVGDGYQKGDKPVSISNLGLLVRTWGQVISVSPENNRFVINDGSYLDDSGLIVDARCLKRPIEHWPEVGDYVCITGISVNIVAQDKSNSPGIRIRDENDIEVLKEE